MLEIHDLVHLQQPSCLTRVEFVLDLADLAGGLGLRVVVGIDRETAAEDAFDDGELVAAAIALRVRGVRSGSVIWLRDFLWFALQASNVCELPSKP